MFVPNFRAIEPIFVEKFKATNVNLVVSCEETSGVFQSHWGSSSGHHDCVQNAMAIHQIVALIFVWSSQQNDIAIL